MTVIKTLSSWSQGLQIFALYEFFWNGNRGARDCLVGLGSFIFFFAVFPNTIYGSLPTELVEQVTVLSSPVHQP